MAARRGTADDGTVDGHVWRRHARSLSPPPPRPSPDLRRGATRTAFPPIMSRGCTLAPRGRVGRGAGHRGAGAPLHPPPWRPRREGGWGGGGERPPLRWPPAPFHPTPPRGCGSTVAGFGGGGWCHGRTAYCRNAGTVHTRANPRDTVRVPYMGVHRRLHRTWSAHETWSGAWSSARRADLTGTRTRPSASGRSVHATPDAPRGATIGG